MMLGHLTNMVREALKAAKRVPGAVWNLGRPPYKNFRGIYASHAEAMADVRSGMLAGYDHDAVVEINFARMCQIRPCDKNELDWLQRLRGETKCGLDLGGHSGTKYRTYRQSLD